MTEPLTERPICPTCLQRVYEVDPGPPPRVEPKAGDLRKRVEEIARKCRQYHPTLDDWADRRDLT